MNSSLVMNVCVLRSLWRVSVIVFWTTVRSSLPHDCECSEPNWETIWRLRKPLQVFWVDYLIGMSPYYNLLRVNWWVFVKCEPKSSQLKEPKTLNYFSLCALNLFNTQVSQFELNYWNKWTFPRHYNLLRCTCKCCLLFFCNYLWIY